MRLGKKPRMPRAALLLLLLLAAVMLCCLGIFLSLSQTTASSEMAEVPYAPPAAGTDGGSNAPPPEESYPLTATKEGNKKDKRPVNASLLTLLVLALASFGASQGAISSCGLGGGGDRRWLAAGRDEGPSFLGVFRL